MFKGLNRFFLAAAAVALIAAPASAQYTEVHSPGCDAYAPIGGTPGATLLAGITNSDDASQLVALPFTFMFYGDTPFNDVRVNSNGGLVFSGSTGSQCCSAYPIQVGAFPDYPVLQVVKEDLDPGDYGDVWYRDNGGSVTISWEGVAFWANTGQANGQVELWPNGDFEVRWSNTAGDSFDDISSGGEDATHAPPWASPVTGTGWDAVGRYDFGLNPPVTGCSLFTLAADEDCANGLDDDGDGAVDCADADCIGDPACAGGGGDCDLTPVLVALNLIEAKLDRLETAVDVLEAKGDRIESTVNALDAAFAALAASLDEIQANQCEMVRLLTTPQGRRTSECGGETYSWNDNVEAGD